MKVTFQNTALLLLLLSGSALAIYYEILPEVGAFIALLGGVFASINYARAVKIKRLEWLLESFNRHMDEPRFRKIRYILVFRVEPDFSVLRDLMKNRADRKVDRPSNEFDQSLINDMDDYLNFFELLATLWNKGELSKKEIVMLYNFYIKNLWQTDFVHEYIVKWGFESLEDLATSLYGEGPLDDALIPEK